MKNNFSSKITMLLPADSNIIHFKQKWMNWKTELLTLTAPFLECNVSKSQTEHFSA
jgi:hypothetical protein